MRTENPRARPLLEKLLATSAAAKDSHAAAEAAAFLLVAVARTVGKRIGYDGTELARSLLEHAIQRVDAPDLRVVGDSGGDSAGESG